MQKGSILNIIESLQFFNILKIYYLHHLQQIYTNPGRHQFFCLYQLSKMMQRVEELSFFENIKKKLSSLDNEKLCVIVHVLPKIMSVLVSKIYHEIVNSEKLI